ncbi:MAG: hypothetical protein ACREQ7_19545 [Candidatus Binatia bacterium]
MDLVREFARGLYLELAPMLDWALKNWGLILLTLLIVVYWSSKHKRAHRHP